MSKSIEKCARNVSLTSSSTTVVGQTKSMGVQRFCSKLRHKIEDNLTTKLCKGSRHSMSLGSLSGISESTTGKYTNKSTKTMHGMLKHKRIAAKSLEQQQATPVMATSSEAKSYAGTYVDSDDEYQMPSLSWTKQSLEDEIFEELEKAAHDETKLNSVLQSFDRILTDFQEEVVKQSPPRPISPVAELPPSRLQSKSVLELSLPASKIPIWKALPLSKRSNSFCSALTNKQPSVINPESSQSRPLSLSKRTVSYMSLPQRQPPRQMKREKSTGVASAKKLVKSKTELNVKTKTKPQNRNNVGSNKPLTPTTKSSLSLRRANTNSDELLDKCLEKGQQILRKIESLGNQTKHPSTPLRSEAHIKKTIAEKVTPGSKYLANKGRQNSDALSDDSGHISNEADHNHTLLSESISSTDDYETHHNKLKTTTTSTTTITTTTNATPNGATRSLKISQLLQKFEAPGIKTPLAETPALICNSLKVAEVEAVHCVRTHVEIFPNYSQEVTTWFY